MMMTPKDYILASCSVYRLNLLKTIGYAPTKIIGADINETPKKQETPTAYVKRMAQQKALKVAENNKDKVVLASDTIVVVGRRIIQKSKDAAEQTKVMQMLSGKSSKVLTAICVVDKNGNQKTRLSTSKVYLKRLSDQEIKDYVASNEWVGSCGYTIEGKLQGYITKIVGSYSSIVGIDLCITKKLLDGVL